MRFFISLFLVLLLGAASSNLPVYAHQCRTMDRQGVFYECYDGESAAAAEPGCCTVKTPANGTLFSPMPCCEDYEIDHSVLDGFLSPQPITPCTEPPAIADTEDPVDAGCASVQHRLCVVTTDHPPPIPPLLLSCISLQ